MNESVGLSGQRPWHMKLWILKSIVLYVYKTVLDTKHFLLIREIISLQLRELGIHENRIIDGCEN